MSSDDRDAHFAYLFRQEVLLVGDDEVEGSEGIKIQQELLAPYGVCGHGFIFDQWRRLFLDHPHSDLAHWTKSPGPKVGAPERFGAHLHARANANGVGGRSKA